MHDLTRLPPSRQRVLLLLAEGHAAKSIATEFGMTEGAVNERLREARRKTGVGSSRDLARRLRGAPRNSSQGNRVAAATTSVQ